jgi:hypothetical protein
MSLSTIIVAVNTQLLRRLKLQRAAIELELSRHPRTLPTGRFRLPPGRQKQSCLHDQTKYL